jgi:surfeit locus 1 family protein
MLLCGRLHPVPLLAGVLVAAIAVQLGNWQLRRAEEKREIGARIAQFSHAEAADLPSADTSVPPEWSRVALQGEWLPEAVMYHDNRVHERRPGYHVLMPLRLADGSSVLINRGWAAAGWDRAVLPEVLTPAGPVRIEGRVVVPEKNPFSLGDSPRDGARWQFVDPAAYAQWSGVKVATWVLQQSSAADDGLLREWPAPALGEDTHRGYALQWYSLAALAAALTGFYVLRSFRKHAA